jgi:uncharacterized delta-60 repeat protein
MRHYIGLCSWIAVFLGSIAVSAGPTDIDQSFRLTDTNIVEIADIELFPDGTIAYGGSANYRGSVPDSIRGFIGKAASNGTPSYLNRDQSMIGRVESVVSDIFDGAVFSTGLPIQYSFDVVSRFAATEIAPPRRMAGTGRKILLSPDRKVVVGGHLGFLGETNRYGLVRMDRRLAIDPTFSFTNSTGIVVTTAALLPNGQILAGYQFTNEARALYGLGRWETNGLRDSAYAAPISLGDAGRITAIEKVPGTNGFILAVERFAAGEISGHSVLVQLDETGSSVDATNVFDDLEIEGTVNAIAFEAMRPETVARGDYDRIIIGGDFRRVGNVPCNNLAAISREGLVEWYFSTNEGPNAPIRAIAVQPDGKILIGGAFTNVSGVAQKCMIRLMGNNGPNQTYFFWADSQTTAFETLGSAELMLLRSGNMNQALSVLISHTTPPGETNAPKVVSRIEFAPGEALARVAVTLSNDTLRQFRRNYSLTAAPEDTNVLVTRPRTDLVILDDETPGSVNPTLNPSAGINATNVETFAVQDDGKVIVALNKLTSAGAATTMPVLLRLNSDGSLDSEFSINTIGIGSFGEVRQIFPRPDGKIYVAGLFTINPRLIPPQRFNHLARLNLDGTLDESFNPQLSVVGSESEHAGVVAAIFTNGDLLVWPGGGVSRLGYRGIFRLDPAGNLVTNFPASFPWNGLGAIVEISQTDDVFAANTPGSSPVPSLTKYSSSGLVDTNLVLHLVPRSLFAMRATGDSLLIAGGFANVNNQGFSNFARVSIETGTLDTNFHPAVNGPVHDVQEKHGKIYIAGSFTEVNGQSRAGLARLNSDGSLDETFDPGFGANEVLRQIQLTSDGDLLVGPTFDQFDGLPINSMARLEGDHETDLPPVSVHLTKEGDAILIEYPLGSLQSSTNLTTWNEIHRGGGQFRTNLGQILQFFRSAP